MPANDYYDSSGVPSTGSQGASATIRAEFDAIEAGFNKLPTMTGNGGKPVVVNAGGTALTVAAAALTLAVALTTAGSGAITLRSTATTDVTLPTSGTLYGTATGSITSSQLATSLTDETGSGAAVFANTPTLVTPILGTPTSGTLTNCTGLPISTGVSGLGSGVATFLATPSSANLASAVTGETGSGALVFGTSPTIASLTITTSPTAAGATWTDLGTVTTADINGGTIDGAVIGGSSAAAGTFTSLTASSGLALSSGNTINFASGNAVITHSSGVLTVSTGDLRVTTAGTNSASAVTVGGTQTLTNKTLTSPTISSPSISGTLTATGSSALGDDQSDSHTITGVVAIHRTAGSSGLRILAASGGDGIIFVPFAAGSGGAMDVRNNGLTDYEPLTIVGESIDLRYRTGVLTSASGLSLSSAGTVTMTTVDINGGAIDGTTIGASSAAAATVTTLASGAITSTGLLTVSLAGNPARFVNTTDAASNQVIRIESDRATPANNDTVYASFLLSDSAGNQDEFARITGLVADVTSTSEDGQLIFGVAVAGTITNMCVVTGTTFAPVTNDLIALGTASLGWADLHGASGFTINIANGNAVITHSSGIFTVSTGDLRVTTAGTNAASVVTVGGTQTLTSKTLTSPVLTTPQINDTSADHQYVFAVSELAADRTVTLPLLTGNDEFVFKDHAQTLTNKTLTSPIINTPSSSGHVYSGTYTPTFTNVANLSGSTAAETQYMRVGNVVTVSGRIQLTTSASGANTQLGISLPIASAFADAIQCGGAASAQAFTECGAIRGDVANARAELIFLSATTGGHTMNFSFSYLIV